MNNQPTGPAKPQATSSDPKTWGPPPAKPTTGPASIRAIPSRKQPSPVVTQPKEECYMIDPADIALGFCSHSAMMCATAA